MEKQIKTLSESNQKQLEQNRKLEAEVQELQSGTEAVEARARNDFGMVEKGETFYQVILEPKQQPAEEKAAQPAVTAPQEQ